MRVHNSIDTISRFRESSNSSCFPSTNIRSLPACWNAASLYYNPYPLVPKTHLLPRSSFRVLNYNQARDEFMKMSSSSANSFQLMRYNCLYGLRIQVASRQPRINSLPAGNAGEAARSANLVSSWHIVLYASPFASKDVVAQHKTASNFCYTHRFGRSHELPVAARHVVSSCRKSHLKRVELRGLGCFLGWLPRRDLLLRS